MSLLSVRWRDGGIEAKCPVCEDYLATTAEFWNPRVSLTRCRACWAEYFRVRQLGYTADEASRACRRIKNRLRYTTHRQEALEYNRRYREANRPRIRAYNAAYKALRAGDPAPMAQYRVDFPDGRWARREPTSPVAERRRQWRESKRRLRGAA